MSQMVPDASAIAQSERFPNPEPLHSRSARHNPGQGPDRHSTHIKNRPQGAVSSLPLTDHVYEKFSD